MDPALRAPRLRPRLHDRGRGRADQPARHPPDARRRAGWSASSRASGVATADATYGAIAAFGLGAITDVLVGARQVLGLVGGVFLLWLAWRTVRSAPTEAARRAPTRRGGLPGAYLSILGLTLANPMTILSFGALFAGLGVTSGATGDAALVVLGVLLGSTTWWVVLTRPWPPSARG